MNWVEKHLNGYQGAVSYCKKENIDFMDLVANSDKYNYVRIDKMVKEYEGLSKLEKARFIDCLKKYMTLMSWTRKKGQICLYKKF